MKFKLNTVHYVILGVYCMALISSFVLALSQGTYTPRVLDNPTPAPLKATPTIYVKPTPEPTPPIVWNEHYDSTYDIRIDYPNRFDLLCCTIEGPAQGSIAEIGIFADKLTVALGTDKPADIVGFFISNAQKVPFPEYMAQEKQALIETYIKHHYLTPETTDSNVAVDGVNSELLIGYNVYGISYTYVPLKSGKVLVIAKTEAYPGSFDFLYQEILNRINLPD